MAKGDGPSPQILRCVRDEVNRWLVILSAAKDPFLSFDASSAPFLRTGGPGTLDKPGRDAL